jgi:hypothetical protein
MISLQELGRHQTAMEAFSAIIKQQHPRFNLEEKVRDVVEEGNSPLSLPSAPISRGDTVTGPLNHNNIDMTKKRLMEHIENCQESPKIGLNAAQVHSDEDKAIDLQSRQTTLKGLTALIAERWKWLSQHPMCSDHTKYSMPVFSGMTGLGKTRMVEEWKLAFKGASIRTDSDTAVIVWYANGTGVCQKHESLRVMRGVDMSWVMG